MSLKLADKWLWDFWIVDDNSCFHIFYLQAPKSISDEKLRHWNTSIGHAISNDLTNWEVLPDVLHIGAPGAWDDYGTWTVPSLVKINERYYLMFSVLQTSHSIVRNQRLQTQPVTGIHYLVADNALGKFSFSTNKFLIGEPTDPSGLLYCGKVVQCRNGNFWFLATRLTDANGDFVGELIEESCFIY